MKHLSLLCLPLLLAGCIQSNPAQTKVHTPYGTVKYHCPPGHAKQGKCYSPHVQGKKHKHKKHY